MRRSRLQLWRAVKFTMRIVWEKWESRVELPKGTFYLFKHIHIKLKNTLKSIRTMAEKASNDTQTHTLLNAVSHLEPQLYGWNHSHDKKAEANFLPFHVCVWIPWTVLLCSFVEKLNFGRCTATTQSTYALILFIAVWFRCCCCSCRAFWLCHRGENENGKSHAQHKK